MQLKFDQLTFEAAHYIPHHEGKCKGIHGHTYIVKNLVIDVPPTFNDQGITIDFAIIKKYFSEQWDHKFIIPSQDEGYWKHIYEEAGFAPVVDNRKVVIWTSAEGMADQIKTDLKNIGTIRDVHFTLYEGLNQGVSV